MYMMIRQKCKKITDARLLQFLNSDEHRQALMKAFDLEFHEQEQVFGIGFHIRDRVKEFIDIDSKVSHEKSIPFVLKMHDMAFPDSEASSKFDKMAEWLEKDKYMSKVCLATGIYFLNNYEGGVMVETKYVY